MSDIPTPEGIARFIEAVAERPLRVGSILYGFCGGWFGRDSYDDKRVEAIGADWVVARSVDEGAIEFAACSPETLTEYLKTEDQ